ncbi:4'-phosphopantetheinyl transferase family protein [Variovorax sp. RHLX14]|uniref:4'-phosphopantetheinyl transferase family protein n=1 Tax=Variovorax sp. RHLX14 TaxID=1259731 RepID=UPI003F460AE1
MNVSPLRLANATRVPCALWRVDLDQHVPAAAHARLSAEEVARASRFVFPRDRGRYIAAHAALRQLLTQHFANAGNAAAAVPTMVLGRHGKPALAAPSGSHLQSSLHFNLSHSRDVGVVAISEDAELGVDIEQIRPMKDAAAMAAAYFTPAEQAALATCGTDFGDAARDRAFFICWTRKEACLKALGIGLYLATGGFEVGISPLEQLVEIATPEGLERLQLQSFADGDAVGALALRCAPVPASRAACASMEVQA